MDKKLKKVYFELQKASYSKCLEPTETCTEPPIRAHSIQNSRILDALCESGHVIMPRYSHDATGTPFVEFKLIGRNQASTFTGLCSLHDAEIFRPIEQNELDITKIEHQFLLAYRSVLKETHACCESAFLLQSGYIQRVESGLSPRDKPDEAGLLATEKICVAYDQHCYKKIFDAAYLARDYERVSHVTIRLDNTLPSIAMSSLFSLDDVTRSEDVARIALNIFPFEEGTVVLFSFLMEDAPYAKQYIQRILDANGFYQKYLISKMILQHCENFVLSPKFYSQMPDEQRQAIVSFFRETLFQNKHDHEDMHLYLFWDTRGHIKEIPVP